MTRLRSEELAKVAPASGAPLSAVQQWMALLLRHPEGLTKSEALRSAAARHFSGNDRLSPGEQIEIYRQQFWLRHTSALVEDFPGLTGLLGQKAWEPIVESYLIERGYDIFALKNLGEHLAHHLTTLKETFFRRAGVDPLLAHEMAALEWAYTRAFDLRDDPLLSAEKLAKIAPEAWASARFVLSPTLSLFRFTYPVADIRRTLKNSGDREAGCAAEKSPHNLVIYRREGTLWDKRVSNAAFLLLEQFHRGVPLVPACEAAIFEDPTAERILETELTQWFTLWGRLGWIVDVVTE
jgi:hypothetical protein